MIDPVNECSPNFDNENKWSKDIETMQSTRPFQCSTSKNGYTRMRFICFLSGAL